MYCIRSDKRDDEIGIFPKHIAHHTPDFLPPCSFILGSKLQVQHSTHALAGPSGKFVQRTADKVREAFGFLHFAFWKRPPEVRGLIQLANSVDSIYGESSRGRAWCFGHPTFPCVGSARGKCRRRFESAIPLSLKQTSTTLSLLDQGQRVGPILATAFVKNQTKVRGVYSRPTLASGGLSLAAFSTYLRHALNRLGSRLRLLKHIRSSH